MQCVLRFKEKLHDFFFLIHSFRIQWSCDLLHKIYFFIEDKTKQKTKTNNDNNEKNKNDPITHIKYRHNNHALT